MSWQNINKMNEIMKSLKMKPLISELKNEQINQEIIDNNLIPIVEKNYQIYPCINIYYQQSLHKVLFQKFIKKYQKTLLSLYEEFIIPYLKEIKLSNFKSELSEIYFEKFCNLAYKHTKY
jgi:hypothetical protein